MEKKRINKKTVIRNFVVILLLVVVGVVVCSKKDKNYQMIQKTKIESSSGKGEVQDIRVASGENQLVINLGNACWMFYEFQDDKVTSLKYYYEYETAREAKEIIQKYQEKGETSALEHEKIEDVIQDGKYVIIIPKATAYEKTTKQEVMDTYTLLQELYQQSE